MSKVKRKKPTSIKHYLVRDFNWRMGQLDRLKRLSVKLDQDLDKKLWQLVKDQQERERVRHELRLKALEEGIEKFILDEATEHAIWQAENADKTNKMGQ